MVMYNKLYNTYKDNKYIDYYWISNYRDEYENEVETDENGFEYFYFISCYWSKHYIDCLAPKMKMKEDPEEIKLAEAYSELLDNIMDLGDQNAIIKRYGVIRVDGICSNEGKVLFKRK